MAISISEQGLPYNINTTKNRDFGTAAYLAINTYATAGLTPVPTPIMDNWNTICNSKKHENCCLFYQFLGRDCILLEIHLELLIRFQSLDSSSVHGINSY